VMTLGSRLQKKKQRAQHVFLVYLGLVIDALKW
jgi:hypothetical protein